MAAVQPFGVRGPSHLVHQHVSWRAHNNGRLEKYARTFEVVYWAVLCLAQRRCVQIFVCPIASSTVCLLGQLFPQAKAPYGCMTNNHIIL